MNNDIKQYVDDLMAEQDAFEAAHCNCDSGRGVEHCSVHAGNHVLPSLDGIVVKVEPSIEVEFPMGEFPYDDAAFERRYPPVYDVESF